MSDQDDYEELQAHTIAQLGLVIERDARGRIANSYRPNPFIIDELFSRGLIDREQHWHAEQFVAMRKVFLRPVGTFKTVTAYSSDSDGSPPAKYPIADNDYLIVLRDMRHEWQKGLVEASAEDEFNIRTLERILAMRPQDVGAAFQALTNAMNRLLKKKEEAREAEEERKKLERGDHADIR